MAQHSDSILYSQDLSQYIRMEEWKNGNKKKTFYFTIEYLDKDTGMFATGNHHVYKTTGALDPDAEYRFFIDRPNLNTVSSRTKLISTFIINKPYTSPMEKIAFHSTDPYKVEWKSSAGGRVYNLEIDFHFLEITATDTTLRTLVWNNFSTVISPSLTEGQLLSMDIAGTSFQSFVKSQLANNPNEANILKRIVCEESLDFHFYSGDDNLYTYMQISQPSTGIVQEKPAFTNIENGIGLFASRYDQSINGKTLSDRTLDSLSTGSYTPHLKFATSAQTINYWSTH
jgi:hypothetical protein